MPATDERELVQQAVAGDRVALERLLLAHYDELARHVNRSLPSTLQSVVDVEDVLQQTFVDAFRSIRTFEIRAGSSFVAWLKVVASHRLTDAIKGQTRKKRGGGRQAGQSPRSGDGHSYLDLMDMLAVDVHTPSQSVAQHEVLQAIQIAVAGLPKEQREAVRMHFLECKSLDETALAMDRTQNAVRGLLHRAKQSLRDMLGHASRWYSTK